METLPAYAIPAAGTLALGIFSILEAGAPLRRRTLPRLRRWGHALGESGLAYLLMFPLQFFLFVPLTAALHARHIGLLHYFSLPGWAATALAVLLLDYSLWHWHWLNHKVPLFWRFHRVHHMDADMDAFTGLRFHAGELGLSLGYRALQIAVIGASPLAVGLWQLILFVCVLFHHSNTRLPLAFERGLARVIVTPRMHGVHHSIIRREADNNYCSILSLWDRLHGTLRLAIPQREIVIGVGGWRDAGSLSFLHEWLSPLRPVTRDWPGDATPRGGDGTAARELAD